MAWLPFDERPQQGLRQEAKVGASQIVALQQQRAGHDVSAGGAVQPSIRGLLWSSLMSILLSSGPHMDCLLLPALLLASQRSRGLFQHTLKLYHHRFWSLHVRQEDDRVARFAAKKLFIRFLPHGAASPGRKNQLCQNFPGQHPDLQFEGAD
jgi:hypothetical protein